MNNCLMVCAVAGIALICIGCDQQTEPQPESSGLRQPSAALGEADASTTPLARAHDTAFDIRSSAVDPAARTLISPDLCVCDDCLREFFDPTDRRYPEGPGGIKPRNPGYHARIQF